MVPARHSLIVSRSADLSTSLDFVVVEYEFPELLEDNWIRVRLSLKSGADSFEKTDPALEAKDLVAIHKWFSALAENRLPRFAHLTFIEPCLSFEFISKRERAVRIAIHLAAEVRPPFPPDFESSPESWPFIAEFEPEELAAIASNFAAAVRRFPHRNDET
jgi:hypothetical protein